MSSTIDSFLVKTAELHNHVCPRQVLGIRMGMLAGELLHLELPQKNKRLFAFVETDGCFSDGVSVATGCWLGHRTLRLMDFGRVAATFVDTQTGEAVRIWPHPESRQNAREMSPDAHSRWHAQLEGYQTLPNEKMLRWQPVQLTLSMEKLISRPGVRVICSRCGEEVINEREQLIDGEPVCPACAGEAYYRQVVDVAY